MLSPDQIVDLLSQNEAFADCPVSILEALASGSEETPVTKGDVLVEKGVKASAVQVAIEGRFGVFIEADAPDPAVTLERGAVFGEIGAVSGIKATATVKALEDGVVLTIPGSELHRHMRRSPELAASILRSLSRYLGKD